MTRFGRISCRRYAAKAAKGEGARLYGGHSNSRGVRVVCASTSLALAAGETFVNLEPNVRSADLVSIEGHIPDGVGIGKLDVKALPQHWNETRDEIIAPFRGRMDSQLEERGPASSLSGNSRGMEYLAESRPPRVFQDQIREACFI